MCTKILLLRGLFLTTYIILTKLVEVCRLSVSRDSVTPSVVAVDTLDTLDMVSSSSPPSLSLPPLPKQSEKKKIHYSTYEYGYMIGN